MAFPEVLNCRRRCDVGVRLVHTKTSAQAWDAKINDIVQNGAFNFTAVYADPSVASLLAAGLRGGPVGEGINELSGREVEVLKLVADGQSNKQIGELLGLSALTVKSHLARIARKLGTGDRAEMVALAMRAGVIR